MPDVTETAEGPDAFCVEASGFCGGLSFEFPEEDSDGTIASLSTAPEGNPTLGAGMGVTLLFAVRTGGPEEVAGA